MNEAKDCVAIHLAKQAVIIAQTAAVFGDLPDERLALFVIVVQMHFHVANAQTDYLGYTVKQLAPVFFLRVKKTVLRALASGIPGSALRNARPLVSPLRDAAKRNLNRYTHANRFIVIGDSYPKPLPPRGPQTLPQLVFQIWR
jgi:hypothetical protein